MGFSSEQEVDEAFKSVADAFASHRTKPVEWRARELKKLWWMFEDNKDRIVESLRQDLNKHPQESYTIDVAGIQTVIVETLGKLKEWTAEERPARLALFNLVAGARVRKEPKGPSLIIAAWNYPYMELFEPLIAAIAAGCPVVLKPSDLAVASQDLIAEIVPKYLDDKAYRVVTAGGKEMPHLLAKPWSHMFFTGSTAVGKIIHRAAAEHLCSTTLELGGQGPAIVTINADVDLAARRIAWCKFYNGGQVCIGVNHVLVDPRIKSEFIAALIKHFDAFMSASTTNKDKKPDYYTRIINEGHFNRLNKVLDKTRGEIVYGGQLDADTLYFPPTIVNNVAEDDATMADELFGPVLPIIAANLDEAIAFTNARPHPLALYLFTKSAAEKDRVLAETLSGGVAFNDCASHILAKEAPFGGVGPSGMGSYHGVWGFREFTHFRTVVDVPKWMEAGLANRYPPYSQKKADALAKVARPVSNVWFTRDGKDKGGFLRFLFARKWRVICVAVFAVAMLRLR